MPSKKHAFHPRNRHQGHYEFDELVVAYLALKPFIEKNKFNKISIDFANPQAVKALNTALLKQYYQLDYWDIPKAYLCPPIPGRADYIHYVADLLGEDVAHSEIKVLDIGCGANCIYPIIGVHEYGWSFVGTDIDPQALDSAQKIVDANTSLKDKIELRLQTRKSFIFKNVLKDQEQFSLCICNPPFHKSAEEARAGSMRKWKNLQGQKANKLVLNFGGQSNELWYPGGEVAFIRKMIKESRSVQSQIGWFTSLVSREDHLAVLENALKRVEVSAVEIIPMGQGNKKSRILAWQF